MANMVPNTVKQYAREDILEAIDMATEGDGSLKSVKERFEAYRAGDDLGSYSVDAIFTIQTADGKTFEFPIEYVIQGNDVYAGYEDLPDLAASLKDRAAEAVTASTKVGKKRIVAADEDYDLVDSVDDLADSVDEMQNSVDEITEDEPDIETDNNVTNHYIAQCDSCNGIFISALAESDQQVSSIQGTCPVCGKDSEQFLRWIVRDLDYVPEDAAPTPPPVEEVLEPEKDSAPSATPEPLDNE